MLAALSLPAAAAAQVGRTSGGAVARGHSLEVSGGLLGATDTEPFADSTLAGAPPSTEASLYTSGRGRLGYRFQSSRLTFASAAGSEIQYYPRMAGLVLAQHDASVSLSTGLGRRVSLHAGHASGYSPFVSSMPLGVLPETAADLVAPPVDAAMARGDTWRHQSDAVISTRLGRHTDLHLSYGRSSYRAADSTHADHRVGVRVTRPLSRRTALRAGYFERLVTRTDGREAARLHEIDAGVDYARALSLTRRTTVTLSTGSGVVTDPTGTRVHLLGDAALAHQIGRTWSAQARYNRSLDLVEITEGPVVADALSLSVGGGVTRRMQWSAGAAYTRAGAAGGGEFGMETAYASTRATLTLTRQAGAYAEYFVHSYRVGRGPLLVDVPAQAQRHGLRIGLSISKTLVR